MDRRVLEVGGGSDPAEGSPEGGDPLRPPPPTPDHPAPANTRLQAEIYLNPDFIHLNRI